ncbi:hypothetical protein ACWC0C_06080 [Streptomyces sp. NPDC001709]
MTGEDRGVDVAGGGGDRGDDRLLDQVARQLEILLADALDRPVRPTR